MKGSVFLVIALCSLLVSAQQPKKRKFVPQPFENQHGLWTGPIVMGTPKQPLQLHLDTTSDAFFVIDGQCKTSGCTKNRKGLQTDKSSTFKELPFRIPYKTTHMGAQQTGRIATECLTALGLGKPPRIPFPLVDATSGEFTTSYGDGVMGLGFVKSGSLKPFTFFQLMTMILDGSAYSFHLDKAAYSSSNGFNNTGYGIYGGIDIDGCDESSVVYHRISKPKSWTIKVEKFSMGTNKAPGSGQVLIKPGPFHILGPNLVIRHIYQIVGAKQQGNGEYAVDCNKVSQLPDYEFHIDGQTHRIKASDYTVPDSDNPSSCILLFKTKDSSGDNSDADWVFGDVVFKGRCVVFDFKKKSIGFTKRK